MKILAIILLCVLLGGCAGTKAKVFKYEDGVKGQVFEVEVNNQAGFGYKEHPDGTVETTLDSRKPTLWERFVGPIINGASEGVQANAEVK